MTNKANKLLETLKLFGISAQLENINKGATVTRYEIKPDPRIKLSKIKGLSDNIAMCLEAKTIRIEAPIPGTSLVGIEVPNDEIETVLFENIINSDEFKQSKSKLSIVLGSDISGKSIIADIATMPHMLIAGSTGSGKSVCINSIIASILYNSTPEEVKFIMIDTKVIELSSYNGIPHLIDRVFTTPSGANAALRYAVDIMTKRYNLFNDVGVKKLLEYNEKMKSQGNKMLPQIVIIIDELADLMMSSPEEVEQNICRLAQMARAAGIHLVIATQRPSREVLTGLIKSNIPCRISFAVSSAINSRIIIDDVGAEKLLGKGDMLYVPQGEPKPIRLQGAYISDEHIERLISYWKNESEVVK